MIKEYGVEFIGTFWPAPGGFGRAVPAAAFPGPGAAIYRRTGKLES